MISLLIGLPAALFLTEGISLATAKIVGLGIIGHHFSLSPDAVLWTICGFILVQLLSMLIICMGLGRTETAELFRSGSVKKQIDIYFVLVLVTALVSSAAAIFTMFTSFTRLPAGASVSTVAMLSAAALIIFTIVEILYIGIVKRTASREISRIEVTNRG